MTIATETAEEAIGPLVSERVSDLLARIEADPEPETRFSVAPAVGSLADYHARHSEACRVRSQLLAQIDRDVGRGFCSQARFKNWKVKTERQQVVKAAVMQWARTWPERRDQQNGLVLYGPVGTGKDHLLVAACRQISWQHLVSVRYLNGRNLFGEFRDRIQTEETEGSGIQAVTKPDILVLSDPVPVSGPLSSYQADLLYRIVEQRQSAGKLTCVTVNIADEKEADSRLGAPTWDRLVNRSWLIHMNWESHRRPSSVI